MRMQTENKESQTALKQAALSAQIKFVESLRQDWRCGDGECRNARC
jgi:hypothetical protein